MTVLTDTHALLWWLDNSTHLSPKAAQVFKTKGNTVIVSTVVPWELAIKLRAGKLEMRVLDRWDEMINVQGFSELPIESVHAIRAGLLPLHHRDPFDRMLVAQAHATGYPIVSADRVFEAYGVRRVW